MTEVQTMKQDVMISIRPRWVKEILLGRKTIEVRRTRPKQETPFRCYIYCTHTPNYRKADFEVWADGDDPMIILEPGKVVAEFVCNKIDLFTTVFSAKHACTISDEAMTQGSRLTLEELERYEMYPLTADFAPPSNGLYGWHISDLKIYEKPRPLYDFCTGSSTLIINEEGILVYSGMKRPPQSWCYVDDADPRRST